MAFESGFKIFLNSYAKKKTDGTITISVEQYSGKKTAVNFFKLRNLINVEVLIRNGGMDGGGGEGRGSQQKSTSGGMLLWHWKVVSFNHWK